MDNLVWSSGYNQHQLNIILLSHERKMGGANKCLYELATELARRGHKVLVAVLLRGCPLDTELRRAGVETIPAFYGWWQEPYFWNILLKSIFRILHGLEIFPLWRLARIVREENIDIIYSNSSCIDIGMKLANITGIKHAWHFREFGASDYNLEYILGRCEAVKRIATGADRIIFISEALKKSYQDIPFDHEYAKAQGFVIYDGISTENLRKGKRHDLTNRPLIFLVSGNLSSAKNQMLVLEAANKLDDNLRYEIWFAGESTSLKASKEYKANLKIYAEENGLKNVKFLGFVDDMVSLREKVDVEIIPSVSEAFGRVTVEAMMAHNLVFASDSGANGELIDNGVTGYLFANQNADSLAELMSSVLNGDIDIDGISEAACGVAEERYSLERNVSQIEKVFLELVQ